MNLNNFFNVLADDASRNFKIAELERFKDNALLKQVCFLALDPFTQFYVRKIPSYEFVGADSEHQTNLEMALQNLSYLSNREVTGNSAIAHLRAILSGLKSDDAKVIERIIQKDLKCGVSVATVNAVWPGLVAEYPCMLCSGYEQKLVDKITFPAYVQMKMDGMRFNAIVRNGGVEFRSRNGKELHLLGELQNEFIALANGVDCVFDGELLIMFPGDVQFADRQTGNGILNKANKGTISAEEAKLVHASLWDVIPYEDFVKGVCKVPYETRWSTVEGLVSKQSSKGKRIWTVWHIEAPNQEVADEKFKELLAEGHEGIILKDKKGIWENKRAKHQIKFKGELECDLKIVAIEMGTGKYTGMLGAIICESSDGVINVRVGSGFNDEQRKTLGAEIIGKIAAVKYNARTKNKQGEESLFLPIFLEVREDKTEADATEAIK